MLKKKSVVRAKGAEIYCGTFEKINAFLIRVIWNEIVGKLHARPYWSE